VCVCTQTDMINDEISKDYFNHPIQSTCQVHSNLFTTVCRKTSVHVTGQDKADTSRRLVHLPSELTLTLNKQNLRVLHLFCCLDNISDNNLFYQFLWRKIFSVSLINVSFLLVNQCIGFILRVDGVVSRD
jgi:hypothetical protein